MRILFLTNFYRVQETGGEDQSCQQVVQGLQERGHTTLVLTSMHGAHNRSLETEGVDRSLYLEMDLVPFRHSFIFFTQRKAREQHNLQYFERVLAQFAPDIIFIWGMWNLPRSLAALAESRYPDRVVYRFASYWPTLPSHHESYWRTPGRTWYARLAKKMLGSIALIMLAREKQSRLIFRHSICVSEMTRRSLVDAGIPVANARVIHTGIDAKRYSANLRDRKPGSDPESVHLLYAGRLVAEKGVETAIRAMENLVTDQGLRNIRLFVAGSGSADYQGYLRSLVSQAGLDDFVSFLGHVHPEEMPQLLQQSDMLLIPSTWAEPFSRMILEGMISGLAVVATPTGGTTEIIKDGENGALFTPGDAIDLARKITGLLEDPERRQKLANAGKNTILEGYTITNMLDQVESFLRDVAGIPAPEKITPLATAQPVASGEFSIPAPLPSLTTMADSEESESPV